MHYFNHSILLVKSYRSGVFDLKIPCVDFQKNISDNKEVQHEVPRGSRLGPLLLIIHINDLYYRLVASILLIQQSFGQIKMSKT